MKAIRISVAWVLPPLVLLFALIFRLPTVHPVVTAPETLLFLGIAIAAFRGGIPVGLLAAAAAWLPSAYFLSEPGRFATYRPEHLQRVVVVGCAALATALLVGLLQRRRHTAETHYHGLFERHLAGVFRVGPEGRLRECNTAFATLLGYGSRGEILGRDVAGFYVDPADHARVARAAAAGVIEAHEVQWRRADGTAVWVMVQARDDHDEDRCLEGVAIDVSARRVAEEARREANALRSVAHLANGAAHEINNPLTIISAQLQIMRGQADGELERRVARMMQAVDRIKTIVSQMGRITRLEEDERWQDRAPMLDLHKSSPPPAGEPRARS